MEGGAPQPSEHKVFQLMFIPDDAQISSAGSGRDVCVTWQPGKTDSAGGKQTAARSASRTALSIGYKFESTVLCFPAVVEKTSI